MRAFWLLLLFVLTAAAPLAPQQSSAHPEFNDIPGRLAAPTSSFDYVKREAMNPMRDGVKIYTVIVVPKGARNAPILLTRTPYNASKRTARNDSPRMLAVLPQDDEVFAT